MEEWLINLLIKDLKLGQSKSLIWSKYTTYMEMSKWITLYKLYIHKEQYLAHAVYFTDLTCSYKQWVSHLLSAPGEMSTEYCKLDFLENFGKLRKSCLHLPIPGFLECLLLLPHSPQCTLAKLNHQVTPRGFDGSSFRGHTTFGGQVLSTEEEGFRGCPRITLWQAGVTYFTWSFLDQVTVALFLDWQMGWEP